MLLSHVHMFPRYEIELNGMIKRYGGMDLLAQHFAEEMKMCANNERSVQCNQIKRCWLSKINPEYRLAENILETELDTDPDTPSRVSANLKGSVATVKDLQKLIAAPQFYSNFGILCQVGEWLFQQRIASQIVLKHCETSYPSS